MNDKLTLQILIFTIILPFQFVLTHNVLILQIELHEVKSKTLNIMTDGSLITFAEVKCPLVQRDHSKSQTFPVLDAYLVAVSFDDINYSRGSPIIVYDSTCTICNDLNGTVDCRNRVDTYSKPLIKLCMPA